MRQINTHASGAFICVHKSYIPALKPLESLCTCADLPEILLLSDVKSIEILYTVRYIKLSYDVASGSEITPCNKIDKPLVVYRFTGNIMTSITTLRT